MESHGVPGAVHLSARTFSLIRNRHQFNIEPRGDIEVKTALMRSISSRAVQCSQPFVRLLALRALLTATTPFVLMA